jgi:hypothetical protein
MRGFNWAPNPEYVEVLSGRDGVVTRLLENSEDIPVVETMNGRRTEVLFAGSAGVDLRVSEARSSGEGRGSAADAESCKRLPQFPQKRLESGFLD